MQEKVYDGVIVGGGIIGTAVAMTLATRTRLRLLLLEAEETLACHQTARNSGVIHAGLYYRPGSLKARTCVRGRQALYRFCKEHGIAHKQCGKVVLATSDAELPQLKELFRRAKANGLREVRLLAQEEITHYEPHARGVAGLYVAETGIVNFKEVAGAYAEQAGRRGATCLTRARFLGLAQKGNRFVVLSEAGEFTCRFLINCAGLYSDRVARLCGLSVPVRIIPFRGEYYELSKEASSLVRHLIYPVPDPRFPFLGVHLTRMIDGRVEAGPNAVLAFKRTGYRYWDLSLRDLCDTLTYRGFWRLSFRYLRTGLAEWYRSLSKRAFTEAVRRLLPEVAPRDLSPAPAGVRAQAVNPRGALVDDFCIVEAPRQVHVLNAPSPAATASLAVADSITALVIDRFSLQAEAPSLL